MNQMLLGALLGGVLTLLTTIVIQFVSERKQRRKGLELIKLELIEISATAWQTPGAFRLPMKSKAWEAHQHLLVGKIPRDDLATLSSFYMQNELFERELRPIPLGMDIFRESIRLMCLIHDLLSPRWEPHLGRWVGKLHTILNPPTLEEEEAYHLEYRATRP